LYYVCDFVILNGFASPRSAYCNHSAAKPYSAACLAVFSAWNTRTDEQTIMT